MRGTTNMSLVLFSYTNCFAFAVNYICTPTFDFMFSVLIIYVHYFVSVIYTSCIYVLGMCLPVDSVPQLPHICSCGYFLICKNRIGDIEE